MAPFLKWAGGKRWLFDKQFIEQLPLFDRYIEPFLGGGAGFFALEPSNALISDLNPDLINLYEIVRDHPEMLRERLTTHHGQHSDEHYYRTRAEKPADKVARAAWLLYLNRTCWNGLYRLNKQGDFNVPKGTKSAVLLPTDDFESASVLLQNARIASCDFETTIDQAASGDLVFIDPPYTVKHNMNGFVKYNESIFSWSDQVRLRNAAERAKLRGAAIVITNADHSSVRELYRDFGVKSKVARFSVISGNSGGRSSITELMVQA